MENKTAFNFKEIQSRPERLAPGHRMCAGCGGGCGKRCDGRCSEWPCERNGKRNGEWSCERNGKRNGEWPCERNRKWSGDRCSERKSEWSGDRCSERNSEWSGDRPEADLSMRILSGTQDPEDLRIHRERRPGKARFLSLQQHWHKNDRPSSGRDPHSRVLFRKHLYAGAVHDDVTDGPGHYFRYLRQREACIYRKDPAGMRKMPRGFRSRRKT